MVIYNTSLFVASIIFSFQVFVCVCAPVFVCVHVNMAHPYDFPVGLYNRISLHYKFT